jgi:hypothetical protein
VIDPGPEQSSESDSDISNENTQITGTSKSKAIRAKDHQKRELAKKIKRKQARRKKRPKKKLDLLKLLSVLVRPMVCLAHGHPVRPLGR